MLTLREKNKRTTPIIGITWSGAKSQQQDQPHFSVRYNFEFYNFYYHTAIFFVYNLIIRYLGVVVDSLSMVEKCQILEKAIKNWGNIWFFNQVHHPVAL